MNIRYVLMSFSFSSGMILHELGCELTSLMMFLMTIALMVFGVKIVERWDI